MAVTPFTDKQIEILNDLLRYHPARRQWEQGIAEQNPKGFGTILDEMNDRIRGLSDTAVFSGDFNSPSSGDLVNLCKGDIIKQVSVIVTEAFTDPLATLTIGTDTLPDEVMGAGLSDLDKEHTYIVICNMILDSQKELKYFLSAGSSTGGKFDIVLTFERGDD